MKKIIFLTKNQLLSNSKLSLIFLLFLQSYTLSATDYYVNAVSGNDRNNGQSVSNAFRTITRISRVTLRPGDNVYFMDGTYTRPGSTLWNIRESGTENAYITIQNYPGHSPVLEFDSWSGLNLINGASYLRFSGLKIKGANSRISLEDALNQPASCARNFEGNANGFYNGVGLLAVGPNLRWSDGSTTGDEIPSHIIVENCEIFDCPSSGLAFQQADYITIRNNKVYNNAWYSIFGTSGVNLYQFINTDNTTGVHNIIDNNLMYGNQLRVPQVPFCTFWDGNALIVDDFDHRQTGNYRDASNRYPVYSATTLITNNVSVENGGSGLHFFLSSNIDVFNNTVVDNAFQNNRMNGNADLRVSICSNINVSNNIFKGVNRIHAIPDNNTNFTYENNYEAGRLQSDFVGGDLCPSCFSGELEFENTDVNAENPYITVKGSSVIDKGQVISFITNDFLGNQRPQGLTYDVGAYEFEAVGDEVENIAPTITLIAPNNGDVFTEGENVSIEYTANDEDGTIATVDFYINDALVSTFNTAPFVYEVTPEVGESTIYAIATDNSGSTTTSEIITITVEAEVVENIAPTITLVAPNNGDVFIEGENVSIEYTANDEDGTIATVDFYINDALVSTFNTAPFVYEVTPEVGESTIYAIATDNSGSATTSGIITITVEAEVVENIAPTITLVAPNNGDVFTEGDSVNIEYTANDEDGTIATVDFYINDALVSTFNTAPFVYEATPEVGESTIYAIATDNSGSTTTSEVITITVEAEVVENIAPTITLVAPNNGDVFTEGDSVNIEYTANDEDGTIATVDFYINDTLVSTFNTAPFVYEATPEVGESTIYAIATDNSGSATTSGIITIKVEAEVVIDDENNICDFSTPLSTPLPTISASYNNVHIIGENGPSLDNLRRFNIKWNLGNNGLYNFSINTNNGQPSWWVNLRRGLSQNLNSENPSLTISNSGFEGLDGEYFARLHSDNFVLISKSGNFTIYFSNSSTPPVCNTSNIAKSSAAKTENKSIDTVTLFPNPTSDYLKIKMNFETTTTIVVYGLDGRLMSNTTIVKDANTLANEIPVYNLSNGTYIVKISADNMEKPIFKYFVKN